MSTDVQTTRIVTPSEPAHQTSRSRQTRARSSLSLRRDLDGGWGRSAGRVDDEQQALARDVDRDRPPGVGQLTPGGRREGAGVRAERGQRAGRAVLRRLELA